MGQEFLAVQCYKCNTFQVHLKKKKPKWSCKICTEKQSVTKVYHRGAAKDCRAVVQHMNSRRGEQEQQQQEKIFRHADNPTQEIHTSESDTHLIPKHKSQWNQYLSSEDEDIMTEEDPKSDKKRTASEQSQASLEKCTRKRLKDASNIQLESKESAQSNYKEDEKPSIRRSDDAVLRLFG